MKNKPSILLFFFLGLSAFAQDGKGIFHKVSDGNLQDVTGEALISPTMVCSTTVSPSTYLDELISKSFKEDPSCQTVFTGNKGDTEEGDETYAKALAYAMAEEMCGNSELHQNFVNKQLTDSDALSLEEFDGTVIKKQNANNAAATYSLIYALGYRESSGNFIRPRDPYADPLNEGTKRETGFTQTSANTLNRVKEMPERHILPQKVFKHYVSTLSKMSSQQQMAKFCLNDKLKGNQQTRLILDDSKGEGKKLEFDHEGRDLHELFKDQSSPCRNLKTESNGEYVAEDKDTDPVVKCFNDLHKNCPGFSIKYGATIARTNRNLHGPLKLETQKKTQKKPDPKPSCQLLFNAIVKDKEKICAEMSIVAGPEVKMADQNLSDESDVASSGSSVNASSASTPAPQPSLSVSSASDYSSGSSTSSSGFNSGQASSPSSSSPSNTNTNSNSSAPTAVPRASPMTITSGSQPVLRVGTWSDGRRPNNKDEELAAATFYGTEKEQTLFGMLNIQALNERLKNPKKPFPTSGIDKCAAGVRRTLNTLFGVVLPDGPDAKDFDERYLSEWETPQSKYLPTGSDSPQEYDIRVLQPLPGSGANPAGHIEIYIGGVWYSDHQQGGSYLGDKYGNPKTFRLTPK